MAVGAAGETSCCRLMSVGEQISGNKRLLYTLLHPAGWNIPTFVSSSSLDTDEVPGGYSLGELSDGGHDDRERESVMSAVSERRIASQYVSMETSWRTAVSNVSIHRQSFLSHSQSRVMCPRGARSKGELENVRCSSWEHD